MSSGYIYVLANSSMPNVVKVGKTTRDPANRAKELAGVTAVPTPFIVVYQIYVEDCDAVESAVHFALSEAGHRVSQNREFFSAPVSDVIDIIITLKAAVVSPRLQTVEDDSESAVPEHLRGLGYISEAYNPNASWKSLYEQAMGYEHGWDNFFEDKQKAIALYNQAARMGCKAAFIRIGRIYEYTYGCERDSALSNAIEMYHQGAKAGNFCCYFSLAQVYLTRKSDVPNSEKALRLGLEEHQRHIEIYGSKMNFLLSALAASPSVSVDTMFEYSLEENKKISPVLHEAVKLFRKKFIDGDFILPDVARRKRDYLAQF